MTEGKNRFGETPDAAVRLLSKSGHRVTDQVGVHRININPEKAGLSTWAAADFLVKKHGFQIVRGR